LLNTARLGNAGCYLLAEVLQQMGGHLRQLNLQCNAIGEDGALKVADALMTSGAPLQVLNIAVNRVGDQGACAFAGLLEEKTCLKMLNLSSNCVTDIGAKALVAALARSPSHDAACVLTDNPVRRYTTKSLENLQDVAGTVNVLARQGVTLGQLLELYTNSIDNGLITPETTTSEVVQALVLPATKAGRCSYIQAMAEKNRSKKANPLPVAHVIHAWDGRFVDLVRCVANHACGKPPGKRDPNLDLNPTSIQWRYNPEWTGKSYFVDVFCVNQWAHTNARALGQFARFAALPAWKMGDPTCEIDKLHLVANRIQQKRGRILVVVDAQRSVLTRVQCLYEVFAAIQGSGDALASSVDVFFTALSSFPPEKRATLVQDSRATDELTRQKIVEEVHSFPGGFDSFNEAVLELIDRHADTELHALLG
jgi:hypothetical protein